jgi:oxygen-dependent protoporphyrinogen oxidase
MSKTVDEDDVSAKGFIYYPDHLVRMPNVVVKPFTNPLKTFTSLVGTGQQVLTEPLFQGLLGELWKGSRRMGNQEEMLREMRVNPAADRSIGDFFADLLGGRQVVDRFLSAMIHGITGGDVWQISMRDGPFADNLIPPRTSDMPVSTRIVRRSDLELLRELGRDKATFNLAKRHVNSTGLWFRDGFTTLPNAMAKALRANPHVTFKLGDRVRKLRYNDQLDKVAVSVWMCSMVWGWLYDFPNSFRT